jgi:hypothetical protein
MPAGGKTSGVTMVRCASPFYSSSPLLHSPNLPI